MSARYTGGLVYNAPGGWSAYFDGSGDYLTLASNTAFAIDSGNFTIECWVYLTAYTSGSQQTRIFYPSNNAQNFDIGGASNSPGKLTYYNGAGIDSAAGAVPLNAWTHIACVRNGTTVTLYSNGNSVVSGTLATTSPGAVSLSIGGESGGGQINGYISNYRVVKGTAVYTSAFTPPVGPLQAISGTSLLTCRYPTIVDGSSNAFTITANGNTVASTLNPFPTSQLPNPALGGAGNGVYTMTQYAALKAANLWPAYDPYYKNVTLNLHGNGTNAAQNNTFLDSSTNNFTITRNGNTTQGTFSPYGSNWSNFFNGSSGVTVSSTSSQFSFSGDFTWEAWVNPSALPSSGGSASIICSRGSVASNSAFQFFLNNNSGTYRVGATISVSSTDYGPLWDIPSAPALGVWYHVAVVRSGSTVQAYWNGTAIGSAQTASGTTNTPTVSPTVGFRGGAYNDLFFNGYISNLRMVGSAVYTSNFTPSTTPLTAISGTRILTCQSNRFIDNSANAFSLTAYSSPSVQRFSPFSPTTAYSTSVIGGSGYFDGSGDYLSASTASAVAFGTGDFCVEMWIFPTTLSSVYVPFDSRGGGTGVAFYTNGATINVAVTGVATWFTGATITANAWTHIAVTRSSSTARLFVNGALISSGTQTTNFGNNTTYIGQDSYAASQYWPGYIADVRVVKGSAVYTAAFTPPTAPLTAITNTQLLTNYTNAGILDNAMMNDLETVGNAQISTSVKKYGSGSMAFDGTGDWLACPPEPVQFGTGSFTIEAWVYPTASRTNPIITRNWSGNNRLILQILSSGAIDVWVGHAATGWYTGTSSTTPCATLNTWYHIALVRNGSTVTAYVNGVSVLTGSTTATMTDSNTTPMYIGYYFGDGSTFQGYIDDLRITKGVARYTANFTPPTSQLQDQ